MKFEIRVSASNDEWLERILRDVRAEAGIPTDEMAVRRANGEMQPSK